MDPSPRSSPESVALALFEQSFTCGQAVLAAFADRYGIELETALRLGCAFGGGIARTGGLCGAVAGALMAIGLAHGRAKVEDVAAREKTYEAVRAFLAAFRAEHGSAICRDLLGHDISTPEGSAAASRAGVFKTRCPELVRTATRVASTLV